MILVLMSPDAGWSGMVRGLEEEGRAVTVRTDVELTSMPGVRSAVADVKPSAVVLAAGWDDIEACESDEARAFALNAEVAINVAAAALEFKAVPVMLSAAEVFGQSGGPFSEADTPEPASTFAQSKLRGEQFIARAAPNALVVRTGPVLEDGLERFAAWLQTDRPEADDEMVSPVGAVDLGRALHALLEAGAKGVVHVANRGAAVSRAELLRHVAKALRIDRGRVLPQAGRSLTRSATWARNATLHTDRLDRVLQAPLRNWLGALEEAAERAAHAPVPVAEPSVHPTGAVEVFTPHPTQSAFGTTLALARAADHHADLLRIDGGKQVPARRHTARARTVHVLEGKVLLEVLGGTEEEDHVLRPGRSISVPAGVAHRLTAVEPSQVLLVWAGGDEDTAPVEP